MQFLYLVASYLVGNILISLYSNRNGDMTLIFGMKEAEIPGARNMGRVYGKEYFIVTSLGDAIKGAIVVSIAEYLFGDSTFVMLALLAVLLGHIYPIVFKGKGGKGISTFIGGLIAFDYLIALTLVAVFIIFHLIFKGFTKPGLITIASLPVCMILYSYSIVTTIL
ncbi:glycerol-3-phosphate 1-O-acyltransferase PlsY [Bacillus pacificus]